jgi:UDP-N-acetylglucosamine--N-acetylmuramyl-(pentapeptide) pyrophosphoryl-undecaprenol N-acetylglucosamine transferase
MRTTTISKPIVLLTGGGTGGHLYPLLAVADALYTSVRGELTPVYVGPATAFDDEFKQRGIRMHRIASSKLRRYLSIENVLDIPRFLWSVVQSLAILYAIMPDAVFSKGGPGAFPVVLAAWCYRIPIVIHESDAVPGFTNRLSAPFAARIAIAFKAAASHFSAKKTARIGIPLRKELVEPIGDSAVAKRALGFTPDQPLLFVVGGSQGSTRINAFVGDNLGLLLSEFQVYHQTGETNLADTRTHGIRTMTRLPDTVRGRYHVAGTLSADAMRTALIAADVILTRAGASAIYEVAASKKPALLVPLPEAASDHQRLNAAEYAATGGAVVVEEANLIPAIVIAEVKKLCALSTVEVARLTEDFRRPDAARTVAQEVLRLARNL